MEAKEHWMEAAWLLALRQTNNLVSGFWLNAYQWF